MYQPHQQKNQYLFQHFTILQVRFFYPQWNQESPNNTKVQITLKKLSSKYRRMGWAKQFFQDVAWYTKSPNPLKSYLYNWDTKEDSSLHILDIPTDKM